MLGRTSLSDDYAVKARTQPRPFGTIPVIVSILPKGRGMVEATARDSWDLEPLSLVPGDVIVFAAVATDNRITERHEGQVTRSASVQIKIISDAEFDIRLRSDMALLEARIREDALGDGGPAPGDESQQYER